MSLKLTDILPEPKIGEGISGEITRDPWFRGHEQTINSHVSQGIKALAIKEPPPYGQRKGFLPRSAEDYGDGGAFPEVHIAQYPLGMGQDTGRSGNTGKTIALQHDKEGKLRHDAIARIGHDKDKIVHTSIANTKQRFIDQDDELLQKPSTEETVDTIRRTKEAIEKITKSKVDSALPVQHAQKVAPAEYIRYTPSQQSSIGNSQQRIIRMVEVQKDPMEPPRFKINSKIPRAPPSPPAPVMHSPPRKITQKEQNDWKIPPCVSNWKNPKAFTISLHQRLAADGRGLQQPQINEKFAKFSEALNLAARTAREGVEVRNEMERRVAKNKKIEEEKKMVELAKQARQSRAQGGPKEEESSEQREEAKKRDEFRRERLDDIRRERNMARNRPDALEKLKNDRDRDISEKIALGLPGVRNTSNETQFDSRLFNQDAGLDSGGIDDETYSVYSKAWRPQDNVQQSIYRPRQQADNPYGDDLDEIVKTQRFVPAKGFQGAEAQPGQAQRQNPVEFEKEDDIFGIGELFQTSRKDKDKEPESNKRRSDADNGHSSSKRSRR
ncbi:SKP-1 protein [Aphelenchoides bicaudatus]|nr:SKP-1 protein [Aphelenchoides bicaudatus]